MSLVVKLSPGERFLNWYAKHTKLYIRGQRGKDWAEQRALDQELWDVLNPWLLGLMAEARAEALRAAAEECHELAHEAGPSASANPYNRAARRIEAMAKLIEDRNA
jgi:acetyl-CoA acetyltransferase